MLLINKLSAPGGIQRVEIRPDTVRIMTREGKDRLYKLVVSTPDDVGRDESYPYAGRGS